MNLALPSVPLVQPSAAAMSWGPPAVMRSTPLAAPGGIYCSAEGADTCLPRIGRPNSCNFPYLLKGKLNLQARIQAHDEEMICVAERVARHVVPRYAAGPLQPDPPPASN